MGRVNQAGALQLRIFYRLNSNLEKIPVVLENTNFFIHAVDWFLNYQHFPRDIVSQVRFRNFPFIIEASNQFLQFYQI